MCIFGMHYTSLLMDIIFEPLASGYSQPFSYSKALMQEYVNIATFLALIYILKERFFFDIDTAFMRLQADNNQNIASFREVSLSNKPFLSWPSKDDNFKQADTESGSYCMVVNPFEYQSDEFLRDRVLENI